MNKYYVGPKYAGLADDHAYAVRNDDGIVFGLFFTEEAAQIFANAKYLAECVRKAILILRAGLTDQRAWSTAMNVAINILEDVQ